ncbi:hypothetical protein HK098_005207 [Nowakowskiella sp. JEL0407]|nr:hypothetical protein HK098_005207 [Nowakowskiella sp. JEL0407]
MTSDAAVEESGNHGNPGNHIEGGNGATSNQYPWIQPLTEHLQTLEDTSNLEKIHKTVEEIGHILIRHHIMLSMNETNNDTPVIAEKAHKMKRKKFTPLPHLSTLQQNKARNDRQDNRSNKELLPSVQDNNRSADRVQNESASLEMKNNPSGSDIEGVGGEPIEPVVELGNIGVKQADNNVGQDSYQASSKFGKK